MEIMLCFVTIFCYEMDFIQAGTAKGLALCQRNNRIAFPTRVSVTSYLAASVLIREFGSLLMRQGLTSICDEGVVRNTKSVVAFFCELSKFVTH